MRSVDDSSIDRRVTVVEAAKMLGITPDAVRSRLRRGTLSRARGPEGEVLVVLDSDQLSDQSPTGQGTVDLVDALRDQIASLKFEVEAWREEARRKDHLLVAALERIPAIEASSDAPSEAVSGGGEPPVTDSDDRGGGDLTQRRSWIYRLFFKS